MLGLLRLLGLLGHGLSETRRRSESQRMLVDDDFRQEETADRTTDLGSKVERRMRACRSSRIAEGGRLAWLIDFFDFIFLFLFR